MTSTEAPPTVVYDSRVTAVGELVANFREGGMLIFFGEQSPEELHDMSIRHHVSVADDGPRPGDTLYVGDVGLEVLAVGEVVRDNLLNLGHLDLKADGRTEAKLPGDVCVAEQELPLPAPDDAFRILRGGSS